MKKEELLLDMIEKDGICLKKRDVVLRQFEDSFLNQTIRFIVKDGETIGFFTWLNKPEEIFINNLFIVKEHRSKNNLIYLREIFEELYPYKMRCWVRRKDKKRRYYV